MSYLLRGMAANGSIRVIATDTSSLVEEARQRHNSSATATAALGRALSGSLLLSHVLLKNHQDRLTVRFRGDGPLGGIITDAGLDGGVRGYVHNPKVDLAPREDGKLDVGTALGQGDIEVIRSHAPYGDPYSSSVHLVSGEIAEDFAMFLAQSEQIGSAVLLGVYLEGNEVKRAGGVLLQALPNAEESALTLLEANIRAFGQLTDAMSRMSLLEVLEELCWGMGFELLTDDALPVRFECRCSEAKAIDALAYFSPEERQNMIAEDGGAEVVCHWCNEKRWLEPDQILNISNNEIRCPDCSTLWYREGQATMIRDEERCACGRLVMLPA
ncbi:MAG: Hsp33 family molecular chaperone HslO [Trueperaceae bacterium]|nr:Hsp33 family molecular chaperone HslO [Trueperaceae bacterium]